MTARGDIRDKEAWALSHWNWGWLAGCFGQTNISPADIDAVLERHGSFLVFETKRPSEPLKKGQGLLLRRLSALPGMYVFVVRGNPDTNGYVWPETIQRVRLEGFGTPKPTSREELRDLVSRWFVYASDLPIPLTQTTGQVPYTTPNYRSGTGSEREDA